MTHVPSGMTATSRESRSQFRNRQLFVRKLRDSSRTQGRPAEGAPEPRRRRALRRAPPRREAPSLPDEVPARPRRRVARSACRRMPTVDAAFSHGRAVAAAIRGGKREKFVVALPSHATICPRRFRSPLFEQAKRNSAGCPSATPAETAGKNDEFLAFSARRGDFFGVRLLLRSRGGRAGAKAVRATGNACVSLLLRSCDGSVTGRCSGVS